MTALPPNLLSMTEHCSSKWFVRTWEYLRPRLTRTGVMSNQSLAGFANRQCPWQTHTLIEFVYLDSLRLWNPDDTAYWKEIPWNHVGQAFVVCSSASRSSHHLPHQSTMELIPWWIWVARNGSKRSHQRGPHWWTKKEISWCLHICAPVGPIQECQQSADDVMKAMQLCTRMWQLETLVELWNDAQMRKNNTLSVMERTWTCQILQLHCGPRKLHHLYHLFDQRVTCPGLVKCRMRSNIETVVLPLVRLRHNCLTQPWGVELWIELFLLPQLNFLSINPRGIAAELWRMDSCTCF